jgi:hypothetical protein
VRVEAKTARPASSSVVSNVALCLGRSFIWSPRPRRAAGAFLIDAGGRSARGVMRARCRWLTGGVGALGAGAEHQQQYQIRRGGFPQVGFPSGGWQTFSQNFTAISDLTLLTFIDTRGAFNAGIYLDDVSVEAVSAVPGFG